jgi:Methyltransferase small domain
VSVLGLDALSPADQQVLREHCGSDLQVLQACAARRLAGFPMAYLLGWVDYRGHRFRLDEQLFITDPETSHMLDLVVAHLRRSPGGDQAWVAELGLGCGSIGISLLKACPEIRLVGLDIDAHAIEMAALNARMHGVAFEALVSDFFSAWDGRPEPAVVYGDLPWGDEDSVYEPQRPLAHYLAMPRHAVFPLYGPIGMHRRALQSVRQRGWSSAVFLNCGMLPQATVLTMAQAEGAVSAEMVQLADNVAVLHCRMH